MTVISMGPPAAKEALKECLSLGADRAFLITDRAFGGSDTYATSYILASSIRHIGDYDLIICGMQAMDRGYRSDRCQHERTSGNPAAHLRR